MSTILIPMAGEGSRFKQEGYTLSKPMIPVTYRKTGEKIPMVIASTLDIPKSQDAETKLIYIDRAFHKQDGIETNIQTFLPHAQFITIDYLTQGQAATCLLAKDLINTNDDLFIGACDSGIVLDSEAFFKAQSDADALLITHTRDENIARNPFAHSWARLASDGKTIEAMSIKQPVSDTPFFDHATTGLFWFKQGKDFVAAAEEMLNNQDKSGGEYYVDQVMQYAIQRGLKVQIFDGRYLCWGTPQDYEEYEKTFVYWREFVQNEAWV